MEPTPGRTFAAFLFDMDGTVLDSIATANRIWSRWAAAHGLDPAAVTRVVHGVRAVESIRRFNLPGVDAEREAVAVNQAETEDTEGVVPIAGAQRFLRSLPPERWALVTSAPRALARARMEAAGLPLPRVLVTSEDVARGKPAPDCFLRAAEALGVAAGDCLAWEDTAAGVAAAEAAGAAVVVVTATHAHPMATRHHVVAGYEHLAVTRAGGGGLVLEERH